MGCSVAILAQIQFALRPPFFSARRLRGLRAGHAKATHVDAYTFGRRRTARGGDSESFEVAFKKIADWKQIAIETAGKEIAIDVDFIF